MSSAEFCSFVPDDPSCQEPEIAPRPGGDGGDVRPKPDGEKMDDHMEEKEARGMEA